MALIDTVKAKVKDSTGRLTDDVDYTPAVAAAIGRYSEFRPKIVTADLAGADGHELDLPLDWEADLSAILGVEYPVGEVPTAVVDDNEWEIYRSPAATQLRLVYVQPATGESVRINYTVSRAEADIPAADIDAVASLAAAMCLETLANSYLDASDPTISADVVNFRTKSTEAGNRAKRLRQLFLDHIGADEQGGPPGASASASYPQDDLRMTHGKNTWIRTWGN